jgi:hypothetical protein
MATSPNFNWPEPDNTDLVKNGALAIRTAVNAIDTSLVDLKGGTTGQVLAKASGTDMDFSWVAQDDSNAIQNAIVDAKGDIIAATANDTPARLAVGTTNGQVLTVDSTTATGLAYKFAGLTHIQTTTFTAAATLNISSVFSSTYDNYRVVCNLKGSTADATVTLRMLTGTTTQDTSSNYFGQFTEINPTAGTSVVGSNATTSMSLGTLETNAGTYYGPVFDFIGPNLASATNANYQGNVLNAGGSFAGRVGSFALNTSTQYTGFALLASTGNLEGGTVRVYGYNNG